MLRNHRGFILLEIIVAMTVLATAILALVQLFSGGLNQAAQADRYLNAVVLAQQKMAELEMGSGDIESQEGGFADSEDYQWQLKLEPYDAPMNNAEAGIEVQKVSLRVFWQDRGQEKEVELVTLQTLGEIHAAAPGQLVTTGAAPTPPTQKPPSPLNPSRPSPPTQPPVTP